MKDDLRKGGEHQEAPRASLHVFLFPSPERSPVAPLRWIPFALPELVLQWLHHVHISPPERAPGELLAPQDGAPATQCGSFKRKTGTCSLHLVEILNTIMQNYALNLVCMQKMWIFHNSFWIAVFNQVKHIIRVAHLVFSHPSRWSNFILYISWEPSQLLFQKATCRSCSSNSPPTYRCFSSSYHSVGSWFTAQKDNLKSKTCFFVFF